MFKANEKKSFSEYKKSEEESKGEKKKQVNHNSPIPNSSVLDSFKY